MSYTPYRGEILPASSADETISVEIDVFGANAVSFYVVGVGTTSSGVITFEEAPTKGYTGTWSSISTMNASDVTGGATKAYHATVSSFAVVRARISTAIGGGGTIAVHLCAF